jgi:hypothetical protein
MSAITLNFKRQAVFGPEEISAMGDAYDFVLRSFPTPPPESAREAIATGIIAVACTGERDPQKLAGRHFLRPAEVQ